MTPTRLLRAPRFAKTAIAAPIDEPPPHATSARSAIRRAIGAWLTCCTNIASGSPGVSTPTASVVTGQPVSHCTAEPKRLAPQNTTWSRPASPSKSSIARRRRTISASEKRGYSASTMACNRGGSARLSGLTGTCYSCHCPTDAGHPRTRMTTRYQENCAHAHVLDRLRRIPRHLLDRGDAAGVFRRQPRAEIPRLRGGAGAGAGAARHHPERGGRRDRQAFQSRRARFCEYHH